jgi:hypothetical protein
MGSACSSKSPKSHLKPLTELTFTHEGRDPLKITTIEESFFQKDQKYILDLYFLLANDAFYLGCLEIAHNGFVFLYQNDTREGNREYIEAKFGLLKKILRFRALYLQENKDQLDEFNKVLGYRCKELKESLQ